MSNAPDKNPTIRMAATNPVPEIGVITEKEAEKQVLEFVEQQGPKVIKNVRKGPKFLMLAYHIHQSLFQDELMIGGFYNWPAVMEGEFNYYAQARGKLKEYDVIFVGLSRPEVEGVLLSKIRKEIGWNSSTKLIATIDYSVALWQNSFHIHTLEEELKQCDALFIPTPEAMSCMRALTGDAVPIYFMPHPTDVKTFKQFTQPIDKRYNALLSLIHRYDNNWYCPAIITKGLEDMVNIYAVILDGGIEMYVTPYFQFVRSGENFSEYLKFASKAKVVLDSYHQIGNYGRSAVDNACLRLPTIATELCFSNGILWPELTTKPNDAYGQRELIKKLLTDREFYEKCTDYAYEKVDMFSYESCRKNMFEFLAKIDEMKRIATKEELANATKIVEPVKSEKVKPAKKERKPKLIITDKQGNVTEETQLEPAISSSGAKGE